MTNEAEETAMEITEIQELLPHRYPFALLDRVVNYVKGESLTGIKNVTINEPFFQGHFPGRPVMPGVLIVEALAQAAGVLAFKTEGVAPGDEYTFYLAGIDNTRFKRPVTPGDQLVLEVTLTKRRRTLWVFQCRALVDGNVAAQADVKVSVQEEN